MKITSIETIELPVIQGMHCVYARIHSDSGIYGLGETGVAIGVGGKAAAEVIRAIAPQLIGMDPTEIDVIWEKMYRNTFWAIGGGAIVMSAISAIDTALWDLKGKAMGVPVANLLGGKHRSKLRAYASQLQMGWNVTEHSAFESPEQLKEAALAAVEQGYTAVKANVLGLNLEGRRRASYETIGHLDPEVLKRADERLGALRDAIGPDKDLIIENHAITDANTALEFARVVENYNVMFMEEPTVPTNINAFKRITEHTNIPLATGERTYMRNNYIPFLENRLLAVLQPDIGNCGGVSEVKKLADMAYCYDVGIQAHVCSSPLSVAVSLQLEAAIPNFVIHEHHMTNTLSCIRDLCIYDYQPVNGYLEVPDLPGFGQDLTPEALKASVITEVK